MSQQSDQEQLLDEMSAFNRKLRAFFDARVREHGLTLARARTLFALSRRGALNQKDLAEELEIETPTLVRLLDGMEKQGVIERRADENDRRTKQIHITPTGRETFADVDALAKELRSGLTEDISSGDVKTALEVVRRLTANIQVLSAGNEKP